MVAFWKRLETRNICMSNVLQPLKGKILVQMRDESHSRRSIGGGRL